MELFSGIVLAVVVLAIAAYLIKEVFGERLDAVVAEYKEKPARSPNHHLLGSTGTVMSVPADSETERDGEPAYVRVRIGIERWDARVTGDHAPAIGTAVRVTAVEGLVLQVEEQEAAAAEPGAAEPQPKSP